MEKEDLPILLQTIYCYHLVVCSSLLGSFLFNSLTNISLVWEKGITKGRHKEEGRKEDEKKGGGGTWNVHSRERDREREDKLSWITYQVIFAALFAQNPLRHAARTAWQ